MILIHKDNKFKGNANKISAPTPQILDMKC